MSLWMIAVRSIQQRGLASFLTSLSMALGVMLVVSVISIHGVVAKSFRTSSGLGYNLIVGAKGGTLQLTLNTVYYLSKPVENVPYEFYLEFTRAEQRDAEYRNSLAYKTYNAKWQATCAHTFMSPSLSSGALARLGAVALLQELERENLDLGRDGKFGQFTALAIPVCLGDYFGRFRVVGTTSDMFDKLTFGERGDRPYEFSAGRNFVSWSEEHGYFEAVVGATVAREKQITVGSLISPAHGDPEGEGHAQKFTVVGILDITGTPNDRAVFVNMEGFFLMDGHEKDLEAEQEEEEEDDTSGLAALGLTIEPKDAAEPAPNDSQRRDPLPIERREVTAILLRTVNQIVGFYLPRSINKGPVGQCVLPIQEITNLFDVFVSPIQLALLTMTLLICVVSGVSILVSIYNSMNDRKHEIAVMRALGASRFTVMTVILFESILLSLGGGMVGWCAAHTLNWLASDVIEQRTGVLMGFFSFAPPLENIEFFGISAIMGVISPELLLVPGLILLAIVVGFLPAMAAYRADVAKSLGP